MFTPDMLDMPTAMAESRHTEDGILNLGLETEPLVFMVVVPELGACRVPAEALSHFMAGENEYAADKMPEHWSGQLSGKWVIKRTQLRVLAESWAKRMALRDRIYAYLEHQQDEADLEKAAASAPVVVVASVALPKQRAQESRILELLKDQGYEPLKLSQRKPGKPGPKAEIRTLAMNEPALFTKISFDKAWERLRNDGAVAGAD